MNKATIMIYLLVSQPIEVISYLLVASEGWLLVILLLFLGRITVERLVSKIN